MLGLLLVSVFSFIIIYVIHYLFNYLTEKLTTTKVKKYNGQDKTYQSILFALQQNQIQNHCKNETQPMSNITYLEDLSATNVSNADTETNDDAMENELKLFMKQQVG